MRSGGRESLPPPVLVNNGRSGSARRRRCGGNVSVIGHAREELLFLSPRHFARPNCPRGGLAWSRQGGERGLGWQGAAGSRVSGRRTREMLPGSFFFLLQLQIMIPLTCRFFFHRRISCQRLLPSPLVIRPCRLISTLFCESTGYYPLWIRWILYLAKFRDVI